MIIKRLAYEPVLARLLERQGVDHSELTQSAAFAALDRQTRLYELAVLGFRRTGDERLGVEVGRKTPLNAFGSLGHALISAGSLRDLLHVSVHYMRLFQATPRAPAQLEVADRRLHLRYRSPVLEPRFPNFVSDLFFASCLNTLIQVGGADPDMFRLELSYSVADPTAHAQAFGVSVHYGAPASRLSAPLDMMQAPFPGRVPAHTLAHRRLADALLRELEDKDDLKRQIQAALANMPGSMANATETARLIGMGERTFRRRLNAAGLSFSDIADEVRVRLARTYLETLSTAEVADLLGYHDASTFRRAFRRWTGVSPATFRQRPGAAQS